MNPFLSTYDIKEFTGLTTILCIEEGSSVLCAIPGSYQFTVPTCNDLFVAKVQSLSFPDTSKIICYDKGELLNASKVFWALKAAGFEDIFILLGGVYLYHDLGFNVTNDPIPEVPMVESNYLPFNNSVFKITSEEMKNKSSYCQKIRADVELKVSTPRGKLIEVSEIKGMLSGEGIKWKCGKAVQVCGRYAPVVAAVLLALGEKSVSILVDQKEMNYLSASKSVAIFNDDLSKAYSVHENSTDFSAGVGSKKTTKSSRRAGTVCGNCSLF